VGATAAAAAAVAAGHTESLIAIPASGLIKDILKDIFND
jgi:hypothetical protein